MFYIYRKTVYYIFTILSLHKLFLAARILSIAADRSRVSCVPSFIFFNDTLFSAISSSPNKIQKGIESLFPYVSFFLNFPSSKYICVLILLFLSFEAVSTATETSSVNGITSTSTGFSNVLLRNSFSERTWNNLVRPI